MPCDILSNTEDGTQPTFLVSGFSLEALCSLLLCVAQMTGWEESELSTTEQKWKVEKDDTSGWCREKIWNCARSH